MNPQGLFASVGINMGLALVILILFSILKKQRWSSNIYYPRPLSKPNNPIISYPPLYSLSRFIPSFSWIGQAFNVPEDEILRTNGLDALILLRLLKFGINFFSVCSLVGLLILLPINYVGGTDESRSQHPAMDSCTISNIRKGSNMLWVHVFCLWLISFYGLYLLYKEYSDITEKRIQRLRNLRHSPDQLTTLLRNIPICKEHNTRGCSVEHFFSKHHPYSYHSYQMLHDRKHIEGLLKEESNVERKIEGLRKRCKSNIGSQDDITETALLGEKLQEICHKIEQLQSEDMLKEKELGVAFVTFKSRWGAAMAAQTQNHTNPTLFITEAAPEPRDVSWWNLAIPYKFLPLQKIGVIIAASLLTLFFAIPVTAVQGIAKYQKLKKWFPPAMAIELIPGLSSVVTGYLPSAILRGFLYVVPFAMLGLAKVGGSISNSKEEIKACNMVFYFLVGNVFFLSLISGSLLDEIGESVNINPKNLPGHFAGLVSSQADFFITYILTDGLSGFSSEVLQPGLLFWDFVKSNTFSRGKERDLYLFSLPYFRFIPTISLSILIGIVYAVIAPLLLPFLIFYFYLGYAVCINQIQDVYDIVYDTCGQFWPFIHHYIFVAIVLMQITMIGLFGMKSKPSASISTIPLLLLTIIFNEYCKFRFLPTFQRHSIQTALENDEIDEKNGEMEATLGKAVGAYRHPSLNPVKFMHSESELTQPLITLL